MSTSTSGVSDFLNQNTMDITNRYHSQKTNGATSMDYLNEVDEDAADQRKPKNELDFEDMLLLMCTQLQNQSIDNTADTNDMMNQLISMTVMKSMTTMTKAMEEVQTASVMNYSASLVGKDVTLGIYDEDGNIEELYGTVEASGTYDGKQVVFVNGQSYFLSSIMAVGKLPEKKEEDTGLDVGGATVTTPGSDENKDVENSGAAGSTDGAESENTTDSGTDSGSSVNGADETAQV